MKVIISPLSLALPLILMWTGASAGRLAPNGFLRSNLNKAEPFIVGGRTAKQGEAPYQLSLKIGNKHFCGATLTEVNGLQIGVTAGHCIPNPYSTTDEVVAGDINFADNTGIEQKIRVERIVVHEQYSFLTLYNDIALLFLNSTFLLSENIQIMPLPTQGQEISEDGNLTVSGWGALEYQGEYPDELQIAEIPLVNLTFCQKLYEDNFVPITDDQLCAGLSPGNVNACSGDSGGPSISDAGFLAGIPSWNRQCGNDYPTVFTKVSHFVDWIHSTVASYQKGLI